MLKLPMIWDSSKKLSYVVTNVIYLTHYHAGDRKPRVLQLITRLKDLKKQVKSKTINNLKRKQAKKLDRQMTFQTSGQLTIGVQNSATSSFESRVTISQINIGKLNSLNSKEISKKPIQNSNKRANALLHHQVTHQLKPKRLILVVQILMVQNKTNRNRIIHQS